MPALLDAGGLPDGPFRGVPVLYKDLGCLVAGEPTAFGLGPLREMAWPVTAVLAATAGVMAMLLLGTKGGPALTSTVSLFQYLGYCVPVACALLSLRVLVVVFGAGSGRCGQGMKG